MGSRKLPSDSEVDFRLWGVGYAFLDWHGACLRVAWGFALSEFVESGHWASRKKETRRISLWRLDLRRMPVVLSAFGVCSALRVSGAAESRPCADIPAECC